ncbi:NusG domain II-containing protein [Enterococcus camelliae]|uniref:NusG domain II-containing protein n=1 Tax=Enterococcus camelliae TaxID=453959 RepID=A0ABW5TLE9_9ENTE
MQFKQFFRNSRMKPWDGVIILLLILFSFLPLVIFSYQQTAATPIKDQKKATTAVLRVDGKEIRTFSLAQKGKTYTYKYEADDGDYNIIEVSGNKIRISDANCGDLICVQRGWISKKGESIVCLPHKLVIEIQTSAGGDDGELIY